MAEKWRKRPVVIEAVRWTGENAEEVLSFADGGPAPLWGDDFVVDTEKREVIIRTLEGSHTGSAGDWIIRGVKGEYYPCKPDIFEATYEPASSADPQAEVEALRQIDDLARRAVAAKGLSDMSGESEVWEAAWDALRAALAAAGTTSGGAVQVAEIDRQRAAAGKGE